MTSQSVPSNPEPPRKRFGAKFGWRDALPLLLLILALSRSFYVGFRVPNAWVMAHMFPSYPSGFVKRALLGSVLDLLPDGLRFSFWFYKWFLLGIVGVIVAVSIHQFVVRPACRTFLLVFYFSANGAYVFHAVGYAEQTVFLFLLAAIAIDQKSRVLGSFLIALTPLIHELSLVFVFPCYGLFLYWKFDSWEQSASRMCALGLPFSLVLLLFGQSASHSAVVARTQEIASRADFHVTNPMFFKVHLTSAHTRIANNYAGHDQLWTVAVVIAVAAVTALLVLSATSARFSSPTQRRSFSLAVFGSIALPLLLGFFGGDLGRWYYMSFGIATTLGCMFVRDIRSIAFPHLVGAGFVAIALVLTLELPYFNRYEPRNVNAIEISDFVKSGVFEEWSKVP